MKFNPTAAIIATLALLVTSTAAFAHPKLVTAAPAANAATSGVTRVKMTFSEALMPKLSGATLTMTGMPGAAKHPDMKMRGVKTSVMGKTIAMVSAKPLPAGSYRVDWHLVGSDTHRITGKYSFTVR